MGRGQGDAREAAVAGRGLARRARVRAHASSFVAGLAGAGVLAASGRGTGRGMRSRASFTLVVAMAALVAVFSALPSAALAANSGAWSTSSGYMSTNTLCFNQYHTRMWSSDVHADLTGSSHQGEWVLAGIHHERWGSDCHGVTVTPAVPPVRPNCDKPTHHINMTWDQARRVDLSVMNDEHCATVQWANHPESNGSVYGNQPAYSGIISRLTLEHGC